ncbi:MAG TPA: ethylbenzene dehydrogenase-related protein [Dehalococcoidia bacterium]
MIKARRVEAADSALINPAGSEWGSAPATSLTLEPTPLISQPSVYVQAKWEAVDYGSIDAVSVQALHNDSGIFFRLQWDDATEDDDIRDTDQFADAAAVLFPVNEDAPLASMGSPQQPVNAWYWRPDMETPFSVTSQGTGSTRRTVDPSLRSDSAHADDAWALVIGRALQTSGDEYVQLSAGETVKVAFAVWQGSDNERAGLKAVTLEWQELELEA